tara:strand:- start:99 stop:971 length:873 start_codon:yes stop_codon:yes gene_type:complete
MERAVTLTHLGSDESVDELDRRELLTGEAVGLDLRPAGFALRAAGAIIDFVALVLLYVALWLGLAFLATESGAEEAVFTIIAIASLVLCIVIIPVLVETLSRGKSLGKLAVGARIVRDDGGAIGFRHAAIRALVGVLEIYMTFGGLAAIVGLMSERSKRLGDLLAGTYAQYERVDRAEAPVFGVPAELASWASTADVARLPDALSRRIAQFLAHAGKFTPERRSAVAQGLATEAAVFVSPIPSVDPELLLAGITVVRRERESAALALEAERLHRLDAALRDRPHGFPERG